MGNIKEKRNIVFGIIAIVIIAGLIMLYVKGLNLSLEYANTKRVELYIGKEFNVEDIKDISNEVIGKENKVQTIEIYETAVAITARDITEKRNIVF